MGFMWRSLGVGIAIAMVPLAASACSSGERHDAEHPVYRDCYWSVTWRGTAYLGLEYVLAKQSPPLTAADVIRAEPATKLGTGYVPECPGDATGSPVEVYSIRGVDPQVAVVTRDHQLGVATGHPVPAELRKHR